MERPPKKYVCEKCGYLGDTSEHEGCDYLAWTTGEQLYIDHLEDELATLRASPASAPEVRESVIEAIAEALGDAYDCTRVWSAWSYGTMSQDDFSLVAEDRSRLEEIADAAMLAAAPTPPVSEGVDPVMTKEELIAAAESIGMRFPGATIPPASEDQKDAERWVDVSKQLPINGDEVLCALTDGCVRVLEFSTNPEKRFIDRDTGKWWWIKVGHWMPLPKAPAMQEDKP